MVVKKDIDYKRNIFLIFIIFFLYAFSVSWAVIQILFFQELSLSFSQISFLLLVLYLAILVLEIPTGVFTDLHGRKLSLILFSIFLGISTFLITVSSSFYFLVFVIILYGLSMSFASGTIASLLFESLKKIGQEKSYVKYLSKSHLIFVGVGVLTNYFMPILFGVNIYFPFYFSCFMSLILLLVTLFIKEPLIKRERTSDGLLKRYEKQFIESGKLIKSNTKIIWFLLFSALFGLAMGIFGDLINQPFIRENYSLELYGIIFALATIVQSILIFYLERIIKFCKRFNIYLILILTWVFSLFIMNKFVSNIYVLILTMAVVWFVGSFRSVLISDEINILISDDSKRATILSTDAMLGSLVLILMMPLFGFFMDNYSTDFVIYLLAGYSLVIGLILLIFKKK